MTKSTITREQAQKIIVAADEVITALAGTNEDVHPDDSKKMCDLWDDLNDRYAPPEVVRELARMALAAMDSEPVEPIWGAKKYPVCRPVPGAKLIVWDETGKFVGYGSAVDTRESGVAIQISNGRRFDSNHDLRWQYALQPVPVVDSELAHEATSWQVEEAIANMESENDMVVVPRGLLGAASGAIRHPRHEAGVVLGALRHYCFWREPAQPAQPAPVTEREPIAWLNDAYLARGVVDGEAGSEDAGPGYIPVYREAQSAPVAPTIPVTDAMAYAFHHALTDGPLGDEDVEDIKTGLRSAFANATTNQPRPVLPDEFDRDKAFDLFNSFPDGDVVDCVQYTWNACRAAMLAVAPPAPKSTVK
ncbi:hypothetical protein [Klebsiella aerogenes]|uniref:hypothetical protein n=1 Tax=Klebsiella aerogenes TaxID=548 RepID=UPI00339C1E18